MMTQKEGSKQSNFFKFIFDGGAVIGDFLLMQLFFLLFSLKGGILLGIFPSIAAVFKIILKWFVDRDEAFKIFHVFNETWKSYFKVANQIGYTLAVSFGFLYLDLRINETHIQSPVLHTLLLIIIFLLAFITIYSFTIMVGHSLKYKEILKQSFFVSISTPIYTLAAIVGLLVVFEFIRYIVFLVFAAGVPLLALPIAWFTFTGLKKIDDLKKEFEED